MLQAIFSAAGVASTASLRRGDLIEAVVEREADAAFVLIGKRGEAADFAKGHLGSNLERVVRAATRPVLVASRSFRTIGRVLIAYDDGPSARRAIDHVAASPLYAGLAFTLVTVGDAPDRTGLAGAAARLAASGIAAETRVVSGDPETALGDLVEREGFDLVVMGAYGHSRIRSLVVGSTTTELIRSCKAPLILLR